MRFGRPQQPLRQAQRLVESQLDIKAVKSVGHQDWNIHMAQDMSGGAAQDPHIADAPPKRDGGASTMRSRS